ncbi:uncharacterized protein F5Z01DRAFT_677171 [Emericellopsis atlantica]|uniref:histidine kinase n=1 Tax=Emericellopsis atlantica TaxID=2614577 RepID=A0A9P8CMY5_9HYPO|nr:uncharacterized protein F5Z01DRAFT_677171 [Emericellopsis atlantica]KAG9251176.1 hypothetical protein F5Z01DRAFT_677171 [Emericellopsis atlantica]
MTSQGPTLGTAHPVKEVSEATRERETLRYDPFLYHDFRANDTGIPIPSSEIHSSRDSILTGLTQLGAYQTGTERAFVSLFDVSHQYVVAEATPTMGLAPNLPSAVCPSPLALCGVAIPRAHGTCEHVLYLQDCDAAETNQLPLSFVPNLSDDARFNTRPYCQFGEAGQFYAAVPIRTKRGINIGSYCVMSTKKPENWSDQSVSHMRDISRAIMNHLEGNRAKHVFLRSERMNLGLSSFIEGKATLSGWRYGPTLDPFAVDEIAEGHLDYTQQSLDPDRAAGFAENDADWAKVIASQPKWPGIPPKPRQPAPSTRSNEAEVLSKASNIIRESFEVAGCLFYDVAMTSGQFTKAGNGNISSTSSSDDQPAITPAVSSDVPCELLGFSTSKASSINGAKLPADFGILTQRLMAKFLRRYPSGKIFNYDASGELETSDSSSDDEGTDAAHQNPPLRARKLSTHVKDEQSVSQIFPGARSVAFIPVWDFKRERWFTGGFVYTNNPARLLNNKSELSFLKAFTKLAAIEVHTLQAVQSDKAKLDALGSLSHELRSPLHGVILGTELLSDTNQTVFQGNATHMIEICCRTLLDTVEHLLDYSKVNSFSVMRNQGPSKSRNRSGEKLMHTDVRLDGLVEEVVESMFAGFNFQFMSVRDLSKKDLAAHNRTMSLKKLTPEQRLSIGDLAVFLWIDPAFEWLFYVQAGAIRRIVMNLFGNALKYTPSGTIKITVTQDTAKDHAKRQRVVKLIVQDTGKGIGEDYLRHKLFTPFAQEDELAPGTGVGLSLVNRIVSQLKGQIAVESRIRQGTTVTVTLPLEQSSKALDLSEDDQTFEEQVREMAGLRVKLAGFDMVPEGRPIVERMCKEALQLELVDGEQPGVEPQLVLWSDDTLPRDFKQSGEVSKLPNVVVCHNALVAYQRYTECEAAGQAGIFEFVSQPIGPRKLTRSIQCAWKRFNGQLQGSVAPRPPGPTRIRSSYGKQVTSAQGITADLTHDSTALSTQPTASPKTPPKTPEDTEIHDFELGPRATSLDLPETASAKKMLLVDDNPINLKVLFAYMKKLGCDFESATNGQEAVDAYKANPEQFRGVLMDISMPVMDGLEATRLIRAHERKLHLAAVPVLALTGLASENACQEAMKSGVDMFLTKPMRFSALSDVLESMNILGSVTGTHEVPETPNGITAEVAA